VTKLLARAGDGSQPIAKVGWPCGVTDLREMASSGHSSLMLDTGAERLLDRATIPGVARFIETCHALGLEAWLAGGIEAPDIPRLLPLKPDGLCIADASTLAIARDLMVAARAVEPRPGPRDKLFVRDLVLDMSVGAYAKERLKPQRVRFNVEAEIARPAAQARDMRDIVSYDLILDAIHRVVAQGHVDLLETLGERVAAELLGHPSIARLTLRLEKLDVGPAIVGIEMARER
jgi:FolB domain-containing protein